MQERNQTAVADALTQKTSPDDRKLDGVDAWIAQTLRPLRPEIVGE
jgi:hypothetical protein